MAKRQPLTRNYLLTILQTRTQKEAAQFLGIGERTIRRIKNEKNHKVSERVESLVISSGTIERKKRTRVTAKDASVIAEKYVKKERKEGKVTKRMRGRGAFTVPEFSVMPPVSRMTRLDPKNIKRRMWSETLNFDVQKLEIDNIKEILNYYRKRKGYQVNIVYAIPKGKQSIGGSSYPKGGFSGTSWLNISGFEGYSNSKWTSKQVDEQLAEILNGRMNRSKKYGHNITQIQLQKRKGK